MRLVFRVSLFSLYLLIVVPMITVLVILGSGGSLQFMVLSSFFVISLGVLSAFIWRLLKRAKSLISMSIATITILVPTCLVLLFLSWRGIGLLEFYQMFWGLLKLI